MVGVGDERLNQNFFSRVEVFDIADNELLLGCKLEYSKQSFFSGVTWFKWRKRD
jgi:hypothetical protein